MGVDTAGVEPKVTDAADRQNLMPPSAAIRLEPSGTGQGTRNLAPAGGDAPDPDGPAAAGQREGRHEAAAGAGEGAQVTVVLQPCAYLAAIEPLLLRVEAHPGLTPTFRLYRDGIYRIEGISADRYNLRSWLGAQPGVASVAQDGATIYVQLERDGG